MDYSKLIKELREKLILSQAELCRAISSFICFGEPVGNGTS